MDVVLSTYPTAKGGMQNESLVGIYTRFCTFGTNLYAQSVLVIKISASELSQKFIKVALLVGYMSWQTPATAHIPTKNLSMCAFSMC